MKKVYYIFMTVIIFMAAMTCLSSCDIAESDEKQEQTGNNDNENGTGNENGETPSGGEDEGETEKVKSMTITLERITATKAYFRASTKKTAPDIEIGVYYSTDAGEHIYDCERVWNYEFENGECELVITGLNATTTYYYRPYLFIDGSRELGDELSFTTTDYSIIVDVVVEGTDVTFTGCADINSTGGIIYSKDTQLTIDNNIGCLDSLCDEFSCIVKGLSEQTTYFYRTYYKNIEDDSYTYGQVKTFTTGKDKYTETNKDLSLTSAVDLSSSGTANCYIVSNEGLYKIKAVKGNDANQTIANASTATILWETFGTDVKPNKLDLIKDFCYKDEYVVFKTSDTYREGNAVIAVKDGSGNILWSWHIWMTDKPQEHVYINNAGTMMDRNLGATSATPGDIGALGLLYQWGRKDPHIGSSSTSRCERAKSTIAFPASVKSTSANGTIEYAIAHPTTFISANSYNSDWCYTGTSLTDNTRWTESDKTKSIYDPCPVGWRVPDGGENGVWKKAGFEDIQYDNTNNGGYFKISSPLTSWYPVTGLLWPDDGSIQHYDIGYYWSATPDASYTQRICNLYISEWQIATFRNCRAEGLAVRCLKDAK